MKSVLFSLTLHLSLISLVLVSWRSTESRADQLVQIQFTENVIQQSVAVNKPSVKTKTRKMESHLSDAVADESLKPNPTVSAQDPIYLQQQGVLADPVFSHLVQQIYQNRIYPYESIRRKHQGQVVVSFYINDQGKIADIAIVQGCPYQPLNQAALKTLKSLKLNQDLPEIKKLFNKKYSFTFEFEIT